ncbi:MAG: tRNA-specific adenosine deaminase, partial [Proteobacteria bacterium]|nr:tRNA-specific adenosine deaminase [Pseudomonadota bacterium]
SLLDHPAHNHAVPATAGVLAEDARSVIDSFVRALRNRPRQSLEDRAEAEVGD